MMVAGTRHYLSVQKIAAAENQKTRDPIWHPAMMPTPPPRPLPEQPVAPPVSPPPLASISKEPPAKEPAPPSQASPSLPKGQQEFFETLVAELKTLRQQNQDLRDQIGETNRDMMEVQFRLDTHSESFRPLKINEPSPDAGTAHDSGPGVLPPRALPAEELPLPLQ